MSIESLSDWRCMLRLVNCNDTNLELKVAKPTKYRILTGSEEYFVRKDMA